MKLTRRTVSLGGAGLLAAGSFSTSSALAEGLVSDRLYWPNESNPSIIDGSWTIPPVNKVG